MTTTFTAFGGGSFQDELTSDDLIVHSDERVENDADENIIADLIDDDDELDDEIVQRNLNFCRDEYLKEFRRSRNQSPSKKSTTNIDEKCEESVCKPRLIMQEEHIEETTKTCKKVDKTTREAPLEVVEMLENRSSGGQVPPQPQSQHQQQNGAAPGGEQPRKDHYSYSYTYKTGGDPDSGQPGCNTVEVNESVTEEIGPDGSKIIRRHQQEKQINKITQVVTQRVIKRQYIDPTTGQIIEYDPNNELFANLPPETVFEEHTIISDDSSGNPPVITTTTTTSKNVPGAASSRTNLLTDQMHALTLGGGQINTGTSTDKVDNASPYRSHQPIVDMSQPATAATIAAAAVAASFRIKSHPEDNQGYPEERNMDYDPMDDSYQDDDSPYEGLIHPPSSHEIDDGTGRKQRHRKSARRKQDVDVNITDLNIVGNSAGSSGSGSSSSPNLFDSHHDNINMPFVSNVYQKSSVSYEEHHHHNKHHAAQNHYHQQAPQQSAYASILPSSNIQQQQQQQKSSSSRLSATPSGYSVPPQQQQQQSNNYSYYHTIGSKTTGPISVDPNHSPSSYLVQQQVHSHRSQVSFHKGSPSMHPASQHPNDYVRNISNSSQTLNNTNNNHYTNIISNNNRSSSSSSVAAQNQNSIYILDNQASIIIHNHHFDSRPYKNQQPQTLRERIVSGGSACQVRFDEDVKEVSASSNTDVFEDDDETYSAYIDVTQQTPVSIYHHNQRSSSSPKIATKTTTTYAKSSTINSATTAANYNRSSSSIDSGIYPCSSPYLETSGVLVGGWRDPTLPEVIEYLSHSSNEIKANAAAYLQHLVYQDDGKKAETRLLGGIGRLISLLNSDVAEVHKNACGALRNLSYGKTNDDNKLEIRDRGGIPALIRLMKRSHDDNVREACTAVLWNLSSCEQIKEQILAEGLSALVKYIIVPYSDINVLNSQANNFRTSLLSIGQQGPNGSGSMKGASSQRVLTSDYSCYPTVLTNATGVLRNCSSNLQFSNCYEARKKLRESEGLVDALLRIVDKAVRPFESLELTPDNLKQVHIDLIHNMNSKCVENCMCILRNLSFRLQEIVDPNYDREVRPMPYDEKTVKCVGVDSGGSKSSKKRKNLEEEFLATVYPYNMPVPQEGRPQEKLWDLATLTKYLIIIKVSTVRDTIEAAVGCLQNLTACYWRPSVQIRQEIRKQKGLPTLVNLLRLEDYEDEPIVSVTAIALRNLAIDGKNRELIGKHAMKELVDKLPDPQRPLPQQRLSVLQEDTITAALACINECIKASDEFVKSCYNHGGVKRMVFITRNANHFQIKIVKYAAHVLASMWKHKNLHDLLKKDGYKETDFTSVAKQMGLKSQSSSPANTLHRPRGDVNVKPSQHGQSQKSKSKANGNKAASVATATTSVASTSKNPAKFANGAYPTNGDTTALNEMPIYSQVQKPVSGASNKNLIITNGTTNADSWV